MLMLTYFYKFINRLKSSPARKNKLILIPFILATLFNLTIWSLIYFKFRPYVYNLPDDQSFIPLHYNLYLGIDKFGHWQKIFYLPLTGFIFLLINAFIAQFVYNKKEILSYFVSILSALMQIIILVATVFIILINI